MNLHTPVALKAVRILVELFRCVRHRWRGVRRSWYWSVAPRPVACGSPQQTYAHASLFLGVVTCFTAGIRVATVPVIQLAFGALGDCHVSQCTENGWSISFDDGPTWAEM